MPLPTSGSARSHQLNAKLINAIGSGQAELCILRLPAGFRWRHIISAFHVPRGKEAITQMVESRIFKIIPPVENPLSPVSWASTCARWRPMLISSQEQS